jgi:ferredoxin
MSVYTLNANSDTTLLDVMERNSIPVQAHCRGGFCGSCRTKVVAGEVQYHIEPLAYIDDDEVLPCACKASTPLQLAV